MGRFISYILLHLLIVCADTEGSTNGEKTGSKPTIYETVDSVVSCSVCQMLVGMVHAAAKSNLPLFLAELQFVAICKFVQNSEVCKGIFDTFIPHVLPAFKQVQIGPEEICSMLIEECPQITIPSHEWTVKLPNVSKSLPQKRHTFQKSSKPIKVLQINDIHLDLEYAVGSVSNCGEPHCCRNFSTESIFATKIPAGRWGDYRCDIPLETLEYFLESIAKQHPDIAYIMWLGDIVPRDIWRQTKLRQIVPHRRGISVLKRIFPNMLILPTIGNHDTAPDGCYPPPWVSDPKFSISWLSKKLVKFWMDWIPSSQKRNVLHGAYYSIHPRPGLRVLSLNTNYCHCRNWWLYINSIDPAEQLEWLVNELHKAEISGERVHIIGHMPPGDKDCLRVWSRNYYDIVTRYENIITAQFFGHTHTDGFQVFYDSKNHSRPVNVAYIGSSVTPSDNVNPSYRIYYFDGGDSGSSWKVMDYETWTLDLDKANRNPQHSPEVFKLYSAKEAYGLENLDPTEWSNLIYRMQEDPELFEKFYRNHFTDSPMRETYDARDKMRLLCELKSAKSRVGYL
ncbi:sphingomyelin phosphodiesterase-like isoform X2 [Photinus pyralis]|uniref:sphingomyelin phosphodiesterase-like isoform X2 n=1 Tax=Photinus pyralis TaxID=7054 RepID=UPI00126751EE|nr:sphingomyelin phosphodiesterase-like isoform X2 [Photinus pyralis]